MITILHGEQHVRSRASLTTQLERARTQGKQVTRLEPKQLDEKSLSVALQTQSLFGEERVIVIEELHSLPKSKKKDALLQALAAEGKNAELDIILWEKKQLTATELKVFPAAKSEVFPLAKVMFTWLGSLTGSQLPAQKTKMVKLLQESEASDGEQFCFAMLARQVRMLIEAKEMVVGATNPKLISQAKNFSWQQLLSLHKQIVLIDQKVKTSNTPFTLTGQLELLLSTL
jgi:hypothetical protein